MHLHRYIIQATECEKPIFNSFGISMSWATAYNSQDNVTMWYGTIELCNRQWPLHTIPNAYLSFCFPLNMNNYLMSSIDWLLDVPLNHHVKVRPNSWRSRTLLGKSLYANICLHNEKETTVSFGDLDQLKHLQNIVFDINDLIQTPENQNVSDNNWWWFWSKHWAEWNWNSCSH